MRTFTDTTGEAWSIDLPFGTVLRIKSDSKGKFDLLDPSQLVEKLARDELEFWELLWHLVAYQAKERNIDAEQFGLRMAADCLHQARQLFFEAWTDFFHQLHRPDRAAAVEKMTKYLAKAIELTIQRLSGPQMATLDQEVESRIDQALNNSFGELQASLASIPDRSPGDS